MKGNVDQGATIYFFCEGALAFYREIRARGIPALRSSVGNGMCATSLSDPDGYRLCVQSPADLPEGAWLLGRDIGRETVETAGT